MQKEYVRGNVIRFVIPLLIYLAMLSLNPSALASDKKTHSTPEGKAPVPAAHAINPDGSMNISSKDRCPVCAMVPARYEKFASAIELADGRTYYFCGTGCMIRSWMHPEVFLNATRDELNRSIARDFFTGRHIDARKATWVAGSDVMGPMGPALIPILTETDVTAFKNRHGGKLTFKLDDMDDTLWKSITGKKAVR